jgi:hypothetical protein
LDAAQAPELAVQCVEPACLFSHLRDVERHPRARFIGSKIDGRADIEAQTGKFE